MSGGTGNYWGVTGTGSHWLLLGVTEAWGTGTGTVCRGEQAPSGGYWEVRGIEGTLGVSGEGGVTGTYWELSHPRVPPMAENHPEPPGTGLQGLVPPSHFVLRPPGPSARMLEAELEAERRRGQALEAELEAGKRRGQALEVELEAERRRSQALEAELEAERRRSQALEVELEAERRRGQAQGAEPGGGQSPEECQATVLLQARLSALGHILTLQERELGRELPPPEVPMAVAPPRLQALLGCWREKVFALLVQLRVQEETQRVLQAQVGALGAAVAAGTRRVTRLELSLRERAATAKLHRRDTERLAQEVTRQRGRAEAAEEALGGLAQAAARLAGVVTAREAEVTAATGTMVTLSARLRRAGQRLRVLQVGGPGLTLSPRLVTPVSPCPLSPGLVAPAVALDRPRWQQDAAGDDPVAEVTGNTHHLAGTTARLRQSGGVCRRRADTNLCFCCFDK
ncbi:coiled-coil alpha-helical rod protein 1-like isoform X3 [Phalacrocorax carbo]|uniref:coiled-coil alpha-helical rod protein 1-like isoform X3 n=1 Tax=Phalacrocorax carbo TaxID=9209 RepID=UPI003119115C